MEPRKTSRARRWLVWLAVLVPVIAVVASGVFAAAVLPGCVTCHSEGQFAAQTRASSHASVSCASCHVPSQPVDRLAFGFRQVFHMAVPVVRGEGRGWAEVPDSRCLKCHRPVLKRVVTGGGIRIAHESCAANAECTDCHSTVAHGDATSWAKTYDMETCLACHIKMGSTQCDLCHEKRGREARVVTGVFAVTHGEQWRETHGMGDTATCAVCHTAANCDKCHGPGLPHGADFIQTHGGFARTKGAKCSGCHPKGFCSDCHGLKMPHSKSFAKKHSKQARADQKLCTRCHVASDCVECHVKHVHPGGSIGLLSGQNPTGTP